MGRFNIIKWYFLKYTKFKHGGFCGLSHIRTCGYHMYLDALFLGFATIENELATVTISELMCGQMYTITAGGIIMNSFHELIGPRFCRETISAPACPMIPTTSSILIGTPMYSVHTCITYVCMYVFTYIDLCAVMCTYEGLHMCIAT